MMTLSRSRVLCDWGGSHLRAFLEVDGAIVDRRDGPGIGTLAGASVIAALRSTLEPWKARTEVTDVYLCGMVGSRNGLIEVPYCPAPAEPDSWSRGCLRHHEGGLRLTIAPGVRGANPGGRPDVMRGEETQVFGAMVIRPQLAQGRHLIVLPGTHSKWIEADAGGIVRFQTFITGELFALLSGQSSLLRVSGDDACLDEGLAAGTERGRHSGLEGSLFEARAAQLLEGRTRGWARGFLSGLLIASEIRAMLHSGLVRGGPTVVGDPRLTDLYARALADQGIACMQLDGTECVIAGLRRLSDRI